jgi:hypothetical protein
LDAEIETNIVIGLLIVEEGIWSLGFVFSGLVDWDFCRKVAGEGGCVWPRDPTVGHDGLLAHAASQCWYFSCGFAGQWCFGCVIVVILCFDFIFSK